MFSSKFLAKLLLCLILLLPASVQAQQMLLLGVGSSKTPVWAKVASTLDTAGSGTSRTVTLSAAVTSGNILVGGLLLNSDAALNSVTDNQGNAYRIVNSAHQPPGGALSAQGFRSVNPITNA